MQVTVCSEVKDANAAAMSNLTFLESEKILGTIEIVLSNGDKRERIVFQEDNIPMFVADLRLFLAKTRKFGSGTWSHRFAPFFDGALVK
jgi:hypothetical protein